MIDVRAKVNLGCSTAMLDVLAIYSWRTIIIHVHAGSSWRLLYSSHADMLSVGLEYPADIPAEDTPCQK